MRGVRYYREPPPGIDPARGPFKPKRRPKPKPKPRKGKGKR